ncbi:IS21 family transposase [Methylocystis sp.]|uniref:IS21 family transposase n=1 Tax=Methylocystis sp. TaxID=1911079 RepID=UPI0025DE4920|nr:IS21 family transposase [Methylocystis sp.]
MFTVELYAGIRRAVMVDGLSRREAAKRFGVHRNTITKVLQYSVPPGYRRRERPVSKKLGPYMAWIDNILEGDRSVHKKQRHTAQRIFERLRDEEGFSGGYTIVREYVARALLRSREMFIPLSHRPGQAQADFGEADAYIAGKKVRFHYFCMDLPHSDGCFVKAYPAETAEAFCDGHVAAFDFFDGVPQSILYDNTRLAVAKIVKGGERLRSQMFAELQSHYLFEDRFGRPGKGNDKGKVEGLVGFVRRNFMTPLPVAESFEAFNARLLDACTKRRQAILRGHSTTIAGRMEADRSAFLPLPPAPYDACHKVATRVSSMALVRYRNNDYSVPTRYGHQEVLAKGYVDRVEIVCRGETIATHLRSYDQAEFIYNPLHYLALLEHKSKALDQAAPLDDWRLADCVYRLRRLMEARMGNAGRREFIQVLRLMEDFHQHHVEQAVAEALRLGAISFDAVKMLLLARLENRPARLDLTFYPYLPAATVGATDPRAYLRLIAGAASAPAAAGGSA